MPELTVKDMNAGQLGFLVKMQLEDTIASFTQKGKLLITDEAPAIRTKNSMAEFLGIGHKTFCKLYDQGVFEGVVLHNASEPRTFTAFPRALRERYTAYCLGQYTPTPKRYYKPKGRTLGGEAIEIPDLFGYEYCNGVDNHHCIIHDYKPTDPKQ